MIVYNVTIKITHAIHEDWLHWLKEEHIPDVISNRLFYTCCYFTSDGS